MRKIVRALARRQAVTPALLVLLTTGGCAVHKELIEKEPVDVAVEHLVQAVDQAIETAYRRHGEQIDLTMTEVSVQLKTSVEKDSSQDFTVSVLEIEAEEDESFTQTLTLTLDPPDKADGTSPHSEGTGDPRLVDRLVEGIDAAILAAKGAKAGLERLHPDGIPLETKKIQVALAFSLTTAGDGVPTISILGIDLGAERTRSRVHTITLTFEVDESGRAAHFSGI